MEDVKMDPKDAARFMGRYARRYHAGAFGSPTAAEIAAAQAQGRFHDWGPGVMGVSKRTTRAQWLRDWTGGEYQVPAGSTVLAHLAAEDGMHLPDLRRFTHVHAYMEDAGVTGQLRAQGRRLTAVRISAASEIVGVFGLRAQRDYAPCDVATLVELERPDAGYVKGAAAEARGLDGWFDDYPFYSDGTWGALSLRGFYPDDPAKGVKPAEMNRRWKAEHPDDLGRMCGWTVLAERCPAAVSLVRWAQDLMGVRLLERVRFLRMAGTPKGGRLGRHTDITDKSSGTRDGQVIRLHIPLVTSPQARMITWNLEGLRSEAHLAAGSMWYLDARKPHAVINDTDSDRIHLVIDALATARARQVISGGRDWAA